MPALNINQYKDLPTYNILIDEEDELYTSGIALVDQPAVDINFMAFSKDQKFVFSTDDKMILWGVAAIPDKPIYRNVDGKEFYVVFTKDTINKMQQIWMRKGLNNSVNLDHSATTAKSFVFQSYVTDTVLGITAPKGLDCPDGSWIVAIQVTDADVWASVKAGERNGFSIEGRYALESINQIKTESDFKEFSRVYSNYMSILNNLCKDS